MKRVLVVEHSTLHGLQIGVARNGKVIRRMYCDMPTDPSKGQVYIYSGKITGASRHRVEDFLRKYKPMPVTLLFINSLVNMYNMDKE